MLPLAKAGDADAMLAMGYKYEEGLGVKASFDDAFSWFQRAYKKYNVEAANAIGYLLASHAADYEDYDDALQWYELAEEGGFPVKKADMDYVKNKMKELGG